MDAAPTIKSQICVMLAIKKMAAIDTCKRQTKAALQALVLSLAGRDGAPEYGTESQSILVTIRARPTPSALGKLTKKKWATLQGMAGHQPTRPGAMLCHRDKDGRAGELR